MTNEYTKRVSILDKLGPNRNDATNRPIFDDVSKIELVREGSKMSVNYIRSNASTKESENSIADKKASEYLASPAIRYFKD